MLGFTGGVPQARFASSRSGIAGARRYQPTIKFLLYQSWLSQQADHLSPGDLIEEFLSDEALPSRMFVGRDLVSGWKKSSQQIQSSREADRFGENEASVLPQHSSDFFANNRQFQMV
jgi:hypothetical protein